MNDMNTKTNHVGIGFSGLLSLTFIVLKLCKVISWSWVWVLAPIWIDACLLILLIIIVAVLASKG